MNKELREAVVQVHAEAEALGIKAVLVGALIMEFTTEFKDGYPAYKRTNDADFAIYVKDWKSFERLRTALEKQDYKPYPHVEHRLVKGTVMVDLIPYGDEVAKGGKISWPDSGFEMSVIGFAEVCAAVTSEVRPGLPAIPVISVPGFVLLKIIAFQDRYARKDQKYQNDADHIRYWLENYAALSDTDTRGMDFALARGWTEMGAEFAGAALLGHEVGKLASSDAVDRIKRFLKESSDADSPFVDALLRKGQEYLSEEDVAGPVEDILTRLRAFQKGF